MVNISMLKQKIEESGITIAHIASVAKIDRSTFYRRLNASGGSFTVAEATAISMALHLTSSEVTSIFFTDIVA